MVCEDCGGQSTKAAVEAAANSTDTEGRSAQTLRLVACRACADADRFVVTRRTAHGAWGYTRTPSGIVLNDGRYEDLLPGEFTYRPDGE